MTTSSDKRTPPPTSGGDHWFELTATLSEESKEAFGTWLGRELELLVTDLEGFETPDSLRKSLRR